MPEIIVFGAGPSAPEFYPWAKQNGHMVIAPSTMLLPLQRAGIRVDVCCIVDGSIVMPLHFVDADTSGELVYVSAVRPDIPQEWKGTRTIVDGRDCCGSSVLHLCVMEAIRRCAEPLHLIGADFCYGRGLSHAEGVVTAYDIHRHEPREETNAHGEKVLTERGLLHFRSELAHIFLKHPGTRVLRYGRSGLDIPGIEWATPLGLRPEGGGGVPVGQP